MAAPSVTNTFANSTTADASQVNTNFNDLIAGASDGTKDYTVGTLTVQGTTTINGSVTLGNALNKDLTIGASLTSDLPIKTNNTYYIGAATLALAGVYLGAPSSRSILLRANQSLAASYTAVLPDSGGTIGRAMFTDGSDNWSWRHLDKITAIKTTAYTATADESIVPCDASVTAAFTVTIPAAASANTGKVLRVQKIAADTGFAAVTLGTGISTTLNSPGETVTIMSTGSAWTLLSRYTPSTWVSYTPTGSWTTNCTYTGFYKRKGDSLALRISLLVTGAPGVGGTLSFSSAQLLNGLTGLTVDTTKIPGFASTDNVWAVGTWGAKDTATQTYSGVACWEGSNPYVFLVLGTGVLTSTSPVTWGNGDRITLDILVPITGWNS